MTRTHLVVDLDVRNLDDNLFELVVLPCVRRALHHRERGVVELVVVNVQEDELGPEVSLFGRADNLGDICRRSKVNEDSASRVETRLTDPRPEELEMLHEAFGSVLRRKARSAKSETEARRVPYLGVENRELGEHAHVRSLESQTSFEQRDHLVRVALRLVQSDESLHNKEQTLVGSLVHGLVATHRELLGVHDEVQTTDLSEAELLLVDTGGVDLPPNPGGANSSVSVRWRRDSGKRTGCCRLCEQHPQRPGSRRGK